MGLLSGVAVAAVVLAACKSDPVQSQRAAHIQVLLQDDPAELIDIAEVWISRVYLVGGGEGQLDLFHDPDDPHHFDLLELQNGVVADLTGEEEIPAGRYGQLRLVVDRAQVTLREGYTFEDGESVQAVQVPSGSRSGIKVLLNGEIEAEPESMTTVLVDFDVKENFVIQGDWEDRAEVRNILFTPVLKEVSRTSANGEDVGG